ncbi:MAG: acyl-CoA dehydrogenase [Actinobacteria bacterium]|nr:acyl-CoA dehydrogenase [Actinomycetota bacterium]
MSALGDRGGEFLAAARDVMGATPGVGALDALGWWDLLPDLDDLDARLAVVGTLRAQGCELADTPALGGLLAEPYRPLLGSAPGELVAAIGRTSPERGDVWVAVGDVVGCQVLFDVPGVGAKVVPAEHVERRSVEVPGRATLAELVVDLDDVAVALTDADCEGLRVRSSWLGRVGASAEILGSAEQAVAMAVEYAGLREQFGRPIGTFQAVRHLLAWASTDCTAVAAVLGVTVDLLPSPPDHLGEVVKALAGRNGRRACERSLQVLGGIGFTTEHDHHHHHGRVLALDALLGSSAELTHDLGSWLRTPGVEVGYTAALVRAAAG